MLHNLWDTTQVNILLRVKSPLLINLMVLCAKYLKYTYILFFIFMISIHFRTKKYPEFSREHN